MEADQKHATNFPTHAQIEAARDAMTKAGVGRFGVLVVEQGMSILDAYGELARAALVAAAGAVPLQLNELPVGGPENYKGHIDCRNEAALVKVDETKLTETIESHSAVELSNE